MSTITALRAPDRHEDSSRAAPAAAWRRLARVAWIQHRSTFIALLVLLVGFAAVILAEVIRMGGSYSAFVADGCVRAPRSATCNADALALGGVADFHAIGIALNLLPLLVGVFLGAPLVAREVESGTFRFSWTQGTRRARTVFTTLGAFAAAGGAAAIVLGLLFGGLYAHIYEVVIAPDVSQWQGTLFATTWWMLSVWMLLGLSLGTFLGAAIRRTVAAMVTAAGVLGGLLVAANVLLPDLLRLGEVVSRRPTESFYGVGAFNAPAQLGTQAPAGSWVIGGWLTGSRGRVLDTRQASRVAEALAGGGTKARPGPAMSETAKAEWLVRHHDAYWIAFQPASHFWLLQGLEGTVVLALTLLLTAGTLRCIRSRRPA